MIESIDKVEYKILWASVPVVNRKRPAIIGICTNSWKPVEKGSFLSWLNFPQLTGPSVQIDKSLNRCSAEEHCLNLACRLNKTTFKSYCDFRHEPNWYRQTLEKKWSKLLKSLENLTVFAEKCKQAYAKDPNIRFIDFTENGIEKKITDEKAGTEATC